MPIDAATELNVRQTIVNYITTTLLTPNDASLDFFGALANKQGKIMCDLFLHTGVTLVATEATGAGQFGQLNSTRLQIAFLALSKNFLTTNHHSVKSFTVTFPDNHKTIK